LSPLSSKRYPRTNSASLYYVSPALNRNPLGAALAITALDILIDENLADRALHLGEIFRSGIRSLNSPFVKEVRGRGLFNAVVIDDSKSTKGRTAWDLCILLKERGVLAKPTHHHMCVCSFFPPFVEPLAWRRPQDALRRLSLSLQ
jgi:acetylornithine/succinyldiaminopimelate/putrescine aminotransferase